MPHEREALPLGLDRPDCGKTPEGAANRLLGAFGHHRRCRAQTRLIPREDDDVSAPHQMLYPRAVDSGVHSAPAMQKHNDGRRIGNRPLGRVEPVLGVAAAVLADTDAGMRVVSAAGTACRLRGRARRRLGRREQNDDCENAQVTH